MICRFCVVLGSKKILNVLYSSEYASGFFKPCTAHLPAAPSPRNEGLLGWTSSRQPIRKPRGTGVVEDFDVEGGRGDSNEAKIEIPVLIDQRSRA